MIRSIVAFTALMVVGLLLVWGGMHNQLMLKKPLLSNDVIFEIKKGDSLDSITRQLQAQQIDIHPLWFKLFAYRRHLGHLMKAGEYLLKKGSTAAEILQQFADGKTRQYAITFPEGWSFKQVFQAINNNPNLQHTIADENFSTVMGSIGSDQNHPEGMFFPDTYFFEKNTSDVELLKRAHDKMQMVLSAEWQKRDQDIPLDSPYQALILASIVEKETAAREERKQIAGVFARRLKKGMLLQTDPTVIYGMGEDYHGDIRLKDLRQPTPYNTYIIEGLPPTPIAMPGKEAIVAALHPDNKSASLYFVAKGDGRHAFSSTLAEHEKYVDIYQR